MGLLHLRCGLQGTSNAQAFGPVENTCLSHPHPIIVQTHAHPNRKETHSSNEEIKDHRTERANEAMLSLNETNLSSPEEFALLSNMEFGNR